MSKVKLAIIGNGMVGHRYIEELIDRTADKLSLVKQGLYEKHGINVLLGERAINVNREQKLILSNTGREVHYDKLIMTTGSYP